MWLAGDGCVKRASLLIASCINNSLLRCFYVTFINSHPHPRSYQPSFSQLLLAPFYKKEKQATKKDDGDGTTATASQYQHLIYLVY
jgi:hypothetical protein